MVNTNKFHLVQLTPEPINSSTPSINNDETPEIPKTPLIPPQQQQQEAYQIALRLHRRSFIDTGCLNNATTTEKENIIALSMLQQLGKYDPSDLKTYKNRNITKLYKKYTKKKTTKTNALLKIYQYIQDISIRVDKYKNNKHNAKRSNKTNLPKTT